MASKQQSWNLTPEGSIIESVSLIATRTASLRRALSVLDARVLETGGPTKGQLSWVQQKPVNEVVEEVSVRKLLLFFCCPEHDY